MAHLTIAVSEDTFQRSFDLLVRNIAWEKSDSSDFGTFTVGYQIQGHLEGGSVDLRDDNTVRVKELDIRWDQFEVSLGIDIRELCVGGGCVDLPWPLPDLCLPRYCIFSGDPDISISPDFSAFIAQEVSFIGSVDARYYDASLPSSGFNLCETLQDALINAEIIEPLPDHNQWHFFIDPETIDVDVFDFPDIVGNLIEDALTNAIEALLPDGLIRDLILAIIGDIADFIRFILDIPDEIDEWLSDLFNISFGLPDFLGTLVLDFFGNCVPLYRLDDPFEVTPAQTSTDVLISNTPVELIPVTVPIENLSVRVNDEEMVIQTDIGA